MTTTSSSTMRSSMRNSASSGRISVRRSLANRFLISSSSATTMSRTSCPEARIALSRSMRARISLYSAMILSRSRAGQPLQAHVEDRLRLQRRQAELLHQRGLGGRRVGRGADRPDHLVEVVEGDDQAFEDVGALLGPGQVVAGPAGDDLLAVLEEVLEHLLEVEHPRLVVDDGQERDVERALHRRELEELVQHHLGDGVALQLDDDADAVAVRLVAQVRDPLDVLATAPARRSARPGAPC